MQELIVENINWFSTLDISQRNCRLAASALKIQLSYSETFGDFTVGR